MAVKDSSGVEQCVAILRELLNSVEGARKAFMNGDACVISRSYLTERLTQLQDMLPDSVNRANAIIKEEQQIRAQAAQECSDALNKAQSKAQQLISDAQRQSQQAEAAAMEAGANAERIVKEAQQRAQEESGRILRQANQEASGILMKAEAERKDMISKENVYRMAAVEADEMRESTRKELGQIRQNAFDYLDNVMGEVDRCLNGLVNDLRMERAELNNHR